MTLSPESLDQVTDVDVAMLRDFLEANISGGVQGELRSRLIAGGRSNPTYEVSDNARSWILRRPPYGLVLPTAHDMGREHRVLTALGPTAVPVPATLAMCEDPMVIGAPFYIMEKVEGGTIRTREQASKLSVDQRAAFAESMVRTLADLHEVDPAAVGLQDWGRPEGYLDRQLIRWNKQWRASNTVDRPEIEQILTALHGSVPVTRFPGIVHGDFKVDNLMIDMSDPVRILAVLDWEMSTVGDTLADLGVMISFWDQPEEFFNPISVGITALEGFPSRDEVVEMYGRVRGIEIPDIDWYIAFADFKIAVILEGIHARHGQGHTSGGDFEGIGDMVGPLLGRALARLRSSSHILRRR